MFWLLADRGNVEVQEMERTFNMGVGMVAVVSPPDADRAVDLLAERGVPAWVLGQITPGRHRAPDRPASRRLSGELIRARSTAAMRECNSRLRAGGAIGSQRATCLTCCQAPADGPDCRTRPSAP